MKTVLSSLPIHLVGIDLRLDKNNALRINYWISFSWIIFPSSSWPCILFAFLSILLLADARPDCLEWYLCVHFHCHWSHPSVARDTTHVHPCSVTVNDYLLIFSSSVYQHAGMLVTWISLGCLFFVFACNKPSHVLSCYEVMCDCCPCFKLWVLSDW